MYLTRGKGFLGVLKDVNDFLAVFGYFHSSNYSLNANNLQNIRTLL